MEDKTLRCDRCRHFKPPAGGVRFDGSRFDGLPADWGVCGMSEYDGEDALGDRPARCMDGSGYHAHQDVAPDFYCAAFTDEPEPQPTDADRLIEMGELHAQAERRAEGLAAELRTLQADYHRQSQQVAAMAQDRGAIDRLVCLMKDECDRLRPIAQWPVSEILTERAKQRKRWSNAHDDGHAVGELRVFAAHILVPATVCSPFDDADWARRNTRDRLVAAGAVIIAELERLRRLGG